MAAASTGMGDGERQVSFKVTLTPSEAGIFNLLRSVGSYYNLGVSLRALGEWVLAKILGQESERIYVGVANIDAQIYTNKLMEYLVEFKLCTGVVDLRNVKEVGAPCIIMSRKLLCFVNVNSGTYTGVGHSCIMERPFDHQDLYHGDLTINSLIYNINDSVLQDITGKGFKDMKNGLVASTSKASILNDPLTALRSIRFAAQLKFTLDEHVIKEACSLRVKHDLSCKISRDKINREVSLMLASENPVMALKHIKEMGLFHTVFLPDTSDPPIDEHFDESCITILDEVCKLLHLIGDSIFCRNVDPSAQAEQRVICMYAALFLTSRETVYVDEHNEKAPIASFILRGTQLISGDKPSRHVSSPGPLKPANRNDISKSVALIHKSCEAFAELFGLLDSDCGLDMIKTRLQEKFCEIPSSSVKRVLAGLLVTKVRELWRISLLLSIIIYAKPESINSQKNMLQWRMDLYIRTEKAIVDLGIDNIWKIGPLLDEESIRRVMNLQLDEPAIKEWQERLAMWQIVHPYGTANECIGWMKQFNDHLNEEPTIATLKDYFDDARVKINRNENQLLERVPSEMLEKEPSTSATSQPPQLSIDDYIRLYCDGSLVKWCKLFFGLPVLIAKRRGASLLCQAYRYVLRKFLAGYCWGGCFTAANLWVTRGGHFFIDIKASQKATIALLLADLRQITKLMHVYFELDGNKAIYMRHLWGFCQRICEMEPSVIERSGKLNQYINFIFNHLSFGFSIERSDLLKGIGMCMKSCSTMDVAWITNCARQARAVYKTVDWKSIVLQVPVLMHVFLHGTSQLKLDNLQYRFGDDPEDNVMYARHCLEHGAERSKDVKGDDGPGGPHASSQAQVTHTSSATHLQSSAAAASAGSGSHGLQRGAPTQSSAAAAASPGSGSHGLQRGAPTQSSAAAAASSSSGSHGGRRRARRRRRTKSSAAAAASAGSGSHGLQTGVTQSNQRFCIPETDQPMPSPKELDYLVGWHFDEFLSETTWEIVSEPNLGKNEFILTRWRAFKRSIKGEYKAGDDESEAGDDESEAGEEGVPDS